MMRFPRLLMAVAISSVLGFSFQSNAHALVAGDLAIIGYNATNPDSFAVVTLVSLSAGTSFTVTDNAATATSGTLATSEGTLTYTAPSAISAGTVLFWQNGGANNSAGFGATFAGNAGFSSSGDNLFLIQGTVANPTFLYSTLFGSAYQTSGATTSNTSYLPSALTLGVTASNITTALTGTGGGVNGYYSGTTTGSRDALLASIGDAANWTKSTDANGATNTASWATSFSVSATTVPEANTGALLALVAPVIGGLIIARRRK